MNLLVTAGPSGAAGRQRVGLGARLALDLHALCILGVVNFVLALRLLPETNPTATAIDVRTLMRHYRQLAFCRPSSVCDRRGLRDHVDVLFVASAPFIFTGELNRPPHEAGFYLAPLVSAWLGSGLASRLVARVPLSRLLVGANLRASPPPSCSWAQC